jgi:uncharacterized protein YdhG (YjbR/CyaY superfamily)
MINCSRIKNITSTTKKTVKGFTNEEKAAMRQHAKELAMDENGESDVLEAIAKMSEQDRTIATRLHVLIKENAPALKPKTWYGFPAYAKDDKVVCFFQYAGKFKTRYTMLGFSDAANLDEGDMWPVTFALKKLTATEEAKIAALVKKAVS